MTDAFFYLLYALDGSYAVLYLLMRATLDTNGHPDFPDKRGQPKIVLPLTSSKALSFDKMKEKRFSFGFCDHLFVPLHSI